MSNIDLGNVVCLVLCAGKGTRMSPLTYTRPKQLLPICNVTVMERIFDAVRLAGITQVGLVVDPDAERLRQHVADNPPDGLQVDWIVQEEANGLADAVLSAREFVGRRPFIVYLGDAVYTDGIGGFVERFARDYPAGLVRLKEVDDPRQYGVATLREDGRITEVWEKPDPPPTNLAITGLYGFPPSFYNAIDRTEPSARGELEITDAIGNFLTTKHGVYGEVYPLAWADAGRPPELLSANEELMRDLASATDGAEIDAESEIVGNVAIGQGSRIEGCRVQGPVIIGRNCRLTDVRIEGPCAIGDGAVIEDSAIRNSIVDEDARIVGVEGGLIDSIVGIGAEVMVTAGATRLINMVLGDDSCIRFD